MKDLRMLQWDDEVEPFLQFVEGIHDVLEIGTGPGGLIQRLGRVTRGKLVSVDLPASGDATGLTLLGCTLRNGLIRAEHPRFVGVLGDSHSPEIQHRVARLVGSVNLLFLDGDDTYEGKWNDFLSYRSMVRTGGFIATHDINSPSCGVPRFWQDMLKYGHKTFSFVGNHPWGGIGVWQCE